MLICFYLFSPLVSAQTPHWKEPEYISQSFIEIALQNEYSTKSTVIRKWSKDISYFIIDHTVDLTLHQKLTRLHLEHLSQITGLNITAAKSSEQADIKIIFSSETTLAQDLQRYFSLYNQREIEQFSRHSVCLAHIKQNKDHSLSSAAVIIPVDRARAHAKLLACIVEELTQVMGLPNDSDKVFPSIFNDRSYNDYLSGLDFILLKLLYDSNIKLGMNARQVKQYLPAIINNKPYPLLIEQAEQLVNKHGLYQLLNN